VSILTGAIRFAPNEHISIKNQLRYGSYDQSYRITEPSVGPVIDPDTPLTDVTATRTERGGIVHQTFLDDQLTATARFATFGLQHTLVGGFEVGRQVSTPNVLKFTGVPSTDLIDPVYQYFTGTGVPSSSVHFTAFTQALFVTDTIHVANNWDVNAAARLDRFDAHYERTVPSALGLEHLDVIPSWRGAVVYRPKSDVNVYAMYGTSFDPSAEGLSLSASTAALAPERSHTVEVGAKWDPTQYVLASAAVFRTVMSNLREASPVDPTFQILAGTARSEGVELSLQGYILPRWIALAGYTYLDASILRSPNGDYGSQLQNAPRHNLRLFSAYDVLANLTVGATEQFTASRVPGTVVDPNGYRQQVPGYWLTSLLARYKLADRVNLQLNLDNIANRRFYDGLDDNHVNVGAGRAARLSLVWER
jgi:catecholate siderophore receptor